MANQSIVTNNNTVCKVSKYFTSNTDSHSVRSAYDNIEIILELGAKKRVRYCQNIYDRTVNKQESHSYLTGVSATVWATTKKMKSLQWRHNDCDGVSNHQPHHCVLSRLFRRRSKKISKLRVTGLCAGNSPVSGEFPAQRPVTLKIFPFDDVIMRKIALYVSPIIGRDVVQS